MRISDWSSDVCSSDLLIVAHAATAVGLAAALPLLIVASPGAGPSAGNAVLPYVVAVAVALAFLELHRHILRGLHAGDLGEALVILLLPVLAAGALLTFGNIGRSACRERVVQYVYISVVAVT